MVKLMIMCCRLSGTDWTGSCATDLILAREAHKRTPAVGRNDYSARPGVVMQYVHHAHALLHALAEWVRTAVKPVRRERGEVDQPRLLAA